MHGVGSGKYLGEAVGWGGPFALLPGMTKDPPILASGGGEMEDMSH